MQSYKRNYAYTNQAGTHWPDATKGSSAWYAIDLACSVDVEKETIESVEWSVASNGLDIIDSLVTDTHEAQVRLEARKAGYYKLSAKITSIDASLPSINVVEVYLKVI